MKNVIASLLVNALLSVLVMSLGLALYHRTVIRPALVIGMVDVSEVYRAKEAEFTQLLTKTALEEDRQKALLMARAFAQRLPVALAELPRECSCLVLIKSAMAAPTPQVLDLTPLLRSKVDAP